MMILYKKYLSLCLMVLGLFACQTIDESERWLVAPEQSAPQSPILIEEYTGQKCINCPEAAEELHHLVKLSAVPHIIVAMHSPYSGLTLPSLANKEAEDYSRFFEHKRSIPGIMLNRELLPTGLYYDQNRASWAALIRQMASRPQLYSLGLQATYSRSKKELNITLDSKLLDKGANPQVGLGLWLVEDVQDYQLNTKTWIKDYQHRNVFRGALNGTWGEDYQVGKVYESTFPLPQSLKDIGKSKVVAFLFNTKTKAIYVSQLKEIEVITNK